MSKIRSARLVEIGRMECEEIDMGSLQPGKVRVQTEMASICGSDLHRVKMGALMEYELPCPHGYPGHEGIGQVVESHSEHLPEGTHVLTFPTTTTVSGEGTINATKDAITIHYSHDNGVPVVGAGTCIAVYTK